MFEIDEDRQLGDLHKFSIEERYSGLYVEIHWIQLYTLLSENFYY